MAQFHFRLLISRIIVPGHWLSCEPLLAASWSSGSEHFWASQKFTMLLAWALLNSQLKNCHSMNQLDNGLDDPIKLINFKIYKWDQHAAVKGLYETRIIV